MNFQWFYVDDADSFSVRYALLNNTGLRANSDHAVYSVRSFWKPQCAIYMSHFTTFLVMFLPVQELHYDCHATHGHLKTLHH